MYARYSYHLGTVALGSMIILIGQIICNFIRALMNNRYMRVFNLCCNITDLIERFLQFLNKNTYIMVAIHGNPFCQSMRDAFNLLMRNIASVYVTSRVTTLQFGMLNLAISSAMAGLTYWFLPKDNMQSELMIYPILTAFIGSSIVAATFFGVYSMAIDTLFLCFCKYKHITLIKLRIKSGITLNGFVCSVYFFFILVEDCERNDGTTDRPYYMSPQLMKVLHKNSESLLPPPYEQVA